jgi:hypothetical protein
MKKTAVVAALVVACSTPAVASTARNASAPYEMPGGVTGHHVGVGGPDAPASWAVFKTKAGEKSVTLSVADASGRPVSFDVEQGGTDLGSFCGTTGPDPVRLPGKGPVAVTPVLGMCGDTVSVPTSGTISAIFRR